MFQNLAAKIVIIVIITRERFLQLHKVFVVTICGASLLQITFPERWCRVLSGMGLWKGEAKLPHLSSNPLCRPFWGLLVEKRIAGETVPIMKRNVSCFWLENVNSGVQRRFV